MIIKKKIWPEYFDKIISRKKNFEIRLADSEYNVGDILVLEEWNPKTERYTGRKIEKKISYILKTKDLKFWKKEDIDKFGFVVISLD